MDCRRAAPWTTSTAKRAARPILSLPMKNLLSRFTGGGEREVRRLQPLVDEINGLEAEFEALSDEEIRERMVALRAEILEDAAPTEPSDDELEPSRVGAPAGDAHRAREGATPGTCRASSTMPCPRSSPRRGRSSRRHLGMRHFDVQLMGGVVLHQGKIAEMKTGEGKTLVAPLAAALNAHGRARRPRRDAQRLPGQARPAVDGPHLPRPGPHGRRHPARHGVRVRPHVPLQRRADAAPAPGAPRRGLRGGRDLRHEQRVRLRLPARQHGPGARPAGAARPLLRHRGRGRQHPHRRGPHAAHHQRPGGGVGGPVLPVRPAGAAPEGAARRRGGGRRLLRRPQGARRLADRGGRGAHGAPAQRAQPVRRRPAHGPPLRAGAARPRALPARPRLPGQGRRDRHRRRVHRAPDARAALVARGCTRRSRPRRACGSSASR